MQEKLSMIVMSRRIQHISCMLVCVMYVCVHVCGRMQVHTVRAEARG